MKTTVYYARTNASDLSAQVRRLLALALGFSPRLAADGRGKPYLADRPDIYISLSHTKGAVACAVSARPVGVDIEWSRPVRPGLVERCCTEAERAYSIDAAHFLEIWTRKEALLKRDGRGLTEPLCYLETLGRPDISTLHVEEWTISCCGMLSEFSLVKLDLEGI